MNFEAAATEVFRILRQHSYEMLLFDDEGKQVFEPNEARRLFCKKGTLGVSIIDDGENSSIRLRHSDSLSAAKLLGLAQALRMTATKYKMVFNMRDFSGSITPKDFSTRHAVSESEISSMNIVEGMYGTSRSSYLKLENARMIVRHSTRINENILGARGRNIETIHIENDQGERYLMPTQQLAPARAMAHHVSNGGIWADPVGEQIARMAQDFANLGAASRHVGHYAPELSESAIQVRDVVREAARSLRKTFECFGRKTRYVEMCETFAQMAQTLTETDETARMEAAAKFGQMLNTESVILSDSVLQTVARVMEGIDPPQADEGETVSIAGHRVSKADWDALKAGKLDLRPDNGQSLTEGSTRREFADRLNRIAARTVSDSMANFIAGIASKIAGGSSDPKLVKIAKAVFRAGSNPSAEIIAPTAAVREFFDWTGSHRLSAIVAETATMSDDEDEGAQDDVSEDACMADADMMPIDEGDEEIAGECEDAQTDQPEGLTREDVLLPKNGRTDLASEVTSADADADEIGRITSLAGMRK